MQNWFDTLSEALASEGLENTWQMHYSPINYGQTFSYTYEDGTKYGHFVSIYRNDQGKYERPVHYAR